MILQHFLVDRSFYVKKWACVSFCVIGIIMLIAYAALIGAKKMPNMNEVEEDAAEDITRVSFDLY